MQDLNRRKTLSGHLMCFIYLLLFHSKQGDNDTRSQGLQRVKENKKTLVKRSEENNNKGTGFRKTENGD